MIRIVKKEIAIDENLRSKIEWACSFANCVPKIRNGSLRIIENTNLAFVAPHIVIIKGKTYLFFNEHDYFYVNNLSTKYPISKLSEIIKS